MFVLLDLSFVGSGIVYSMWHLVEKRFLAGSSHYRQDRRRRPRRRFRDSCCDSHLRATVRPFTMGFVLKHSLSRHVLPHAGHAVWAACGLSHIELILAALILLVSLPKLSRSFIFKTPQSLALIGLAVAAILSVLIGDALGRGSGARRSWISFRMPSHSSLCACIATRRGSCRFWS